MRRQTTKSIRRNNDRSTPKYWIHSQEDGVALWGPYTKKDAENYLYRINQFNKSGKNIYKIKLDKDWRK